MKTFFALALLGALFSGCAQGVVAPPKPVSLESLSPRLPLAWVELGPSGRRIARVVTAAPKCPTLEAGGSVPMAERAAPDAAFPVRVCEADVPAKAVKASVAGRALKLPPARIRRVVVLGDTGCRVLVSGNVNNVQDCANPAEWPFARVAASAAALKPDLVIHVGDYLYRETDVGKGPFGDRLDTWWEDFFGPAGELLGAAPWVFVRGNHESCARFGQGFRRFLDPAPLAPECQELSPAYWIKSGGLDLAVLDVAAAHDFEAPPVTLNWFSEQFKALSSFPLSRAWLLIHRPLWNVERPDGDLIQASRKADLRRYRAVFAGHAHFFADFRFDGPGPREFVAGNGGTKLLPVPQVALEGRRAGGRMLTYSAIRSTFGFIEMRADAGGGWRSVARDEAGKVILESRL